MNDRNELLPEDLDSLVNDLQQDKPFLLPDSQRIESDFVNRLIHTARSAHIDEDYATRLGQYINRKHHRRASTNKGMRRSPPQPVWFSWRSVALALTSMTLVTVLSISSLLNSQISPVILTPPISENTFDSSSTPLKATLPQPSTNTPLRVESKTPQSISQLQVVQAPVPPHTPLPLPKTLDAPSNRH